VQLDALVGSRADAGEMREAMRAQGEASLMVYTDGSRGGLYEVTGEMASSDLSQADIEPPRSWAASEPPGPRVDSYGCGDSFAAALTYGLGCGWEVPDALALAARCGAACLTGRGPYERQLILRGGEGRP
jgi:ribokinase